MADRASKEEQEEDAAVVVPPPPPDLRFEDITDGTSERGIPAAKFIDGDVDAFAASICAASNGEQREQPTAELLIGAYTELHSQYKSFEARFTYKSK